MRPIPPAPLDPGQLDRALAPFGESRMLPRDAYLSPEVLAWERRHLFEGWMCLGRDTDIPPGGFRVAQRTLVAASPCAGRRGR